MLNFTITTKAMDNLFIRANRMFQYSCKIGYLRMYLADIYFNVLYPRNNFDKYAEYWWKLI